MELRTLRYVLAIVDHGSVTAAAAARARCPAGDLPAGAGARGGARRRAVRARRAQPPAQPCRASAPADHPRPDRPGRQRPRDDDRARARRPGSHHRRGASHDDRGRDRAVRRRPRHLGGRRPRSSSPPPMRPTRRSRARRSTWQSRRALRRRTSPRSSSPGSRSGRRSRRRIRGPPSTRYRWRHCCASVSSCSTAPSALAGSSMLRSSRSAFPTSSRPRSASRRSRRRLRPRVEGLRCLRTTRHTLSTRSKSSVEPVC